MNEPLFFCYSDRLKRALTANGFKYICVGLNVETNTKFWLFWGTHELNDYKENQYQKERDLF